MDVIVDEDLFKGDFDDIPDHINQEDTECMIIPEDVVAGNNEEKVVIDESLFDVDDFQTLNLDDADLPSMNTDSIHS